MISYRYANFNDIFEILSMDKNNFSNNFDKKFYYEYIKDKKIIIAEEAKKVISYVLFNYVLDEAEIYKIVVLKEFRKKQIAFELMRFLFAELSKINIQKIFLEVREGNIPAIKLYKKLGFTNIREIVDYYTNPKENGYMMIKEGLYE